ncbi:MAG: peptide deformylase [Tepidisphaeraceae bacterium]|jgi:peptide deformylase
MLRILAAESSHGMYEDLRILLYPDPRLRKISVEVRRFDEGLSALAKRMFELMREAKGVGLAAPQVGHGVRLFVVNPTGKPEDDRVYVNPVVSDAEGEETSQEGCLSLPGINVEVTRPKAAKLRAKDLAGNPVEQTETGYVARIWQHELDHLNGVLIVDRAGPTAKMESRKILKELEEKYNTEKAEEERRKSR